jgi:S-adenosyl-L-methionine hydrolase (adenosine-forming)
MKGVILGINPEARLVDLSHQIAAFDVLEAAFALLRSYPYFPDGTIHVAVVDPGVGSARRPMLASTGRAHFVGPDNGVFSLVCECEPSTIIRHVTAERYFLDPVSQTFHGRDIFSPVAAWLSKGVPPEQFGPSISDPVRLASAAPERAADGVIRGAVIHVDKFGNVFTNLKPADFPPGRSFRLLLNGREITRLVTGYAAGEPGELFAIAGSAGFVEIAANRSSAAGMLGAERGAGVSLIFD